VVWGKWAEEEGILPPPLPPPQYTRTYRPIHDWLRWWRGGHFVYLFLENCSAFSLSGVRRII
jgi:hypothetical protein